jgi:hypothetical protein
LHGYQSLSGCRKSFYGGATRGGAGVGTPGRRAKTAQIEVSAERGDE